jgi:hypothetical protein
VVVVVDNSYSMQAEGRRAAVESWLAPQLAGLRAPDQLGVLLMHPTPTWLVPLSGDLEVGRNAVKTLPEGYETSRYRAGLELAGTKLALGSHKQKQIWLAGDQQRIGWSGVRFERSLPPGVELLPAPSIPAPKRQAAITELKAARASDGKVSLAVTVRSFSPGTDERTVTFYAGGEKLGAQRCTLAHGNAQGVYAEFPVPDVNAALMLHATIDGDELPVDDTAYVALAAVNDRRVLLAEVAHGESVDFLAVALGAVRGGKLPTFRVDPLPSSGVPWAPSTVAVLRGADPFRNDAIATLETFLAAGGSAWIMCDGSPEQTSWLARHGINVSPTRLASGAKLKLRDLVLDHALFASFAGHSIAPLLTPTFRRGWSLQGEAVEALARWPDRSIAIAEVPVNGGRLLLTGFGDTRADSTFPVEPGYVPFVHQAVTWLAESQMAAPIGCRVGATLVLPGAGTWRAVLSPKPVVPVEANGHVTPAIPGIYAFEQAGAPQRFYAVNVDPIESDLSPWPTPGDFARLVNAERENGATQRLAAGTASAPVVNAALVDERQAWWWLLIAAIVVLLLEVAIANRTVL